MRKKIIKNIIINKPANISHFFNVLFIGIEVPDNFYNYLKRKSLYAKCILMNMIEILLEKENPSMRNVSS
jgi:hypothetical protein